MSKGKKTKQEETRKVSVAGIGLRPKPHEIIPEGLRKRPGVRVLSSARVLAKNERYITVGVMTTAYQASIAKYNQYSVQSGVDIYAGMNPLMREYRRNFLVRRSINSLAFWTTKEGFKTALEPSDTTDKTPEQIAAETEPYTYVKTYIDKINKDVDLDNVLRNTIIAGKTLGHCGYEIDRKPSGDPQRLLPLDNTSLNPLVDQDWVLQGFQYEGRGTLSRPEYKPDQVLYFVFDDLDGSMEGISEIEPILKEADLDDKIFREDLPEALTTLWAGIILYTIDRSKMPNATDAEIETAIADFIDQVKPGKSIATEAVWTGQAFDVKPNLDQILNVSERVERRIVGNFGVPRFMLNLEYQGWNRETASRELEVFVDGPITDLQRRIKRQLEAQWYLPLTELRLGRTEARYRPRLKLWRGRMRVMKAQEADLPVVAKHQWNEIRTADWLELLRTGAQAYGNGTGAFDQRKFYELMSKGKATSWDVKELDEKRKAMLQVMKEKPTQVAPTIPSPSA